MPGNRGYKYFGAAKDLPGVRELFSQEPQLVPRKTRAELMKDIDADYYGFRDEDDGVIVPLEIEAQKKAILEALSSHKEGEENSSFIDDLEIDSDLKRKNEDEDEDDGADFVGPKRFLSHVPSIPTQEEVQEELLRRKKQELLERYASESVVEADKEARELLGIK